MRRPIEELLLTKSPEQVRALVEAAKAFAEARMGFSILDLQNGLRIGYGEAAALYDLLSDASMTQPLLSTHMLRCGRRYVLNCPLPTLAGMADALNIGSGRAFSLMLELERRNVLRIGARFELYRVKRMSTWDDLVRQVRWVGKKYRGRCEPELLTRILFVDRVTAIRLAQYGEEKLGLRWKNRPRHML